jgi:hypothetical protein
MTQLGCMVSSEPFTAGISDVYYHFFFLISLRPVTFMFDFLMCYLHNIFKKMECTKNNFKCDALCSSHRLNDKHSKAICGFKFICE